MFEQVKYITIKKILILYCTFSFNPCFSFSQNVGIGIAEPINKLHVLGNLLINAPYTFTNTAPTPAQTKTMTPGSTLYYFSADSTGLIFDPGGPNGNYGNNQTAQVVLDANNNSRGYEIILEDVELNAGDSLIIDIDGNPVLAVGNGYSTTGKWIINASLIYINFKSNNDGITGRGFNLIFRRLYENTVTQKPLNGYVGKSLFFDTKKGAFRAGGISVGSIGDYSTALGYFNTASGLYSTAVGIVTKASGQSSFAAGQGTLASGLNSIAMGYTSEALGEYSFALGSFAKAQANNSVAIGGTTTASGPNSFAVGFNTKAIGFSALAMGNSTQANGNYSMASGFGTIATGNYSFSSGNSTIAGGDNSVALGYSTSAAGAYSTAMGYFSNGSGFASTALGYISTASGNFSSAFGYNSTAGGAYSTAIGINALANGNYSTAIGNNTTASGEYSTVIGNYVTTSGFNGAFAIGDNSTTTVMESFVANGFRSRFAGGYRLLTNSAATIGVVLLASGNAWSAISDVHLKENFFPVDGESFLKKIAAMPLTTWNYIGQDAKTLRHYGPMAQDFYKAFGQDELGKIGCDTLINQQDFLGVNLIAIQALEKRTSLQENEIKDLKVSNALLQQQIYMLMKKIK